MSLPPQYKLKAEGKLADVGMVPDVYVQNQALDKRVHDLMEELSQTRAIAGKATATWDQLRKERDFHKMHHKRVVQEKNKLITDIKRIKNHYLQYEPLIKELRSKVPAQCKTKVHTSQLQAPRGWASRKPERTRPLLQYEAVIKEKMLVSLEKDRLLTRVEALEAELMEKEEALAGPGMMSSVADSGVPGERSQRGREAAGTGTKEAGKTVKAARNGLPATDPENPFLHLK